MTPCIRMVEAGVVDDRLKWSGLVGLSSQGARRVDAGQVALERRSGARHGPHRLLRSIAVAPM